MRQMKFRGRHLTQGYWVYSAGVLQFPYSAYLVGEDNERWQVKPQTLGQYTGISDRNGVEVYEGDIIESVLLPLAPSGNTQTVLGVVEWRDDKAGFIVNCNNIRGFDLQALRDSSGYRYADGMFGMDFAVKGVVSGNIHER